MKIDCKGNITKIFKIILERNYVTIVKAIGNTLFSNPKFGTMFHVFLVFCKTFFTIWALSGNWMFYFFLFFNVLSYITSIGEVNFICKVTRNWHIFIINWFINNINWSKFNLFCTYKFMFYYLIPIKIFL